MRGVYEEIILGMLAPRVGYSFKHAPQFWIHYFYAGRVKSNDNVNRAAMVLSNDNVTQPALLSHGRLGSQGIVDILRLAGYGLRHGEETWNAS